MTIEFDDNGKFFTNYISKDPLPVIIQTKIHRIHGNIHIRPDQRLKDQLDETEKFVAVTDAFIYSVDGQVLYQTRFLALRCDEIIWVVPQKEITESLKEFDK